MGADMGFQISGLSELLPAGVDGAYQTCHLCFHPLEDLEVYAAYVAQP